jgi:hypothetical protein
MENMMRLMVVIVGFILYGAFAQNPANAQTPLDWPMFGQNTANTASNPSETSITAKNVKQLQPNWTFTTGGDVSARAAVVNGVAYFPDWAGNLYAVNANNGRKILVAPAFRLWFDGRDSLPYQPGSGERHRLRRNTVGSNRGNRMAAGDQCEDRFIGVEGPAGYIELFPRDHRLTGCG